MIQISRRNIPDVLIDARLIQLTLQTFMHKLRKILKFSKIKLFSTEKNNFVLTLITKNEHVITIVKVTGSAFNNVKPKGLAFCP